MNGKQNSKHLTSSEGDSEINNQIQDTETNQMILRERRVRKRNSLYDDFQQDRATVKLQQCIMESTQPHTKKLKITTTESQNTGSTKLRITTSHLSKSSPLSSPKQTDREPISSSSSSSSEIVSPDIRVETLKQKKDRRRELEMKLNALDSKIQLLHKSLNSDLQANNKETQPNKENQDSRQEKQTNSEKRGELKPTPSRSSDTDTDYTEDDLSEEAPRKKPSFMITTRPQDQRPRIVITTRPLQDPNKTTIVVTSRLSQDQNQSPHSNRRGGKKRVGVGGILPETVEVCEEPEDKRQKRIGLAGCLKIIKSLMEHRYGWPFNQPVDPVALNIPDYLDIIKTPMDFGTIKTKLMRGQYSSLEEFSSDVSLVFSNAYTYNPPEHDICLMAKTLSGLFDKHFSSLKSRMEVRGIDSSTPDSLEGNTIQNTLSQIKTMREENKRSRDEPNSVSSGENSPDENSNLIYEPSSKRLTKPKGRKTRSLSLSVNEKNSLLSKIHDLSSEEVQTLVNRFPQLFISFQENPNELQIDDEQMDYQALKSLEKYLRSVFMKNEKKKEQNLIKKTSSTSSPSIISSITFGDIRDPLSLQNENYKSAERHQIPEKQKNSCLQSQEETISVFRHDNVSVNGSNNLTNQTNENLGISFTLEGLSEISSSPTLSPQQFSSVQLLSSSTPQIIIPASVKTKEVIVSNEDSWTKLQENPSTSNPSTPTPCSVKPTSSSPSVSLASSPQFSPPSSPQTTISAERSSPSSSSSLNESSSQFSSFFSSLSSSFNEEKPQSQATTRDLWSKFKSKEMLNRQREKEREEHEESVRRMKEEKENERRLEEERRLKEIEEEEEKVRLRIEEEEKLRQRQREAERQRAKREREQAAKTIDMTEQSHLMATFELELNSSFSMSPPLSLSQPTPSSLQSPPEFLNQTLSPSHLSEIINSCDNTLKTINSSTQRRNTPELKSSQEHIITTSRHRSSQYRSPSNTSSIRSPSSNSTTVNFPPNQTVINHSPELNLNQTMIDDQIANGNHSFYPQEEIYGAEFYEQRSPQVDIGVDYEEHEEDNEKEEGEL